MEKEYTDTVGFNKNVIDLTNNGNNHNRAVILTSLNMFLGSYQAIHCDKPTFVWHNFIKHYNCKFYTECNENVSNDNNIKFNEFGRLFNTLLEKQPKTLRVSYTGSVKLYNVVKLCFHSITTMFKNIKDLMQSKECQIIFGVLAGLHDSIIYNQKFPDKCF